MIGYKATYNMKCETLTYEVGKTYTFNGKLIMCKRGFHFCKRAKDVLNYYSYNKDFKLLEIEVLGEVIASCDKSLTDSFKVLRIVPVEEYPELLGITLDSNGNQIKEIGFNDAVKTFKYDEKGNKIEVVSPFGISRWEYDEKGNVIKDIRQSDSIYESWVYEYDENGNLIKQINGDGSRWYKYEYDVNGNKIKDIYADGAIVQYEYDDHGNMTKKIHYNGNIYQYEYDADGNMIKEIYPDGDIYQWEYDDHSNKIKKIDSSGNIYQYEYDGNGNKIKQIGPSGIYIWEYDENGSLIKEIYPNGDTWSIDISE